MSKHRELVIREQDYADLWDILSALIEAEIGDKYRDLELIGAGMTVETDSYWEYSVFWHDKELIQLAKQLLVALEKAQG